VRKGLRRETGATNSGRAQEKTSGMRENGEVCPRPRKKTGKRRTWCRECLAEAREKSKPGNIELRLKAAYPRNLQKLEKEESAC